MSEHEGSAAPAFYDHEVEEPGSGTRSRAVADWGVGEEIFDHMPRRRLRGSESHRRDGHPRPRRSESTVEEPRARRFEPTVEEPRERRFEPTLDESTPAPLDEPAADMSPIPPLELAPEPPADFDAVAPPPEGRRTVVIRGRGAEAQWTPRNRPPRTVGERIGPRPDRLAAWAVALGMLLILIAILTAHG